MENNNSALQAYVSDEANENAPRQATDSQAQQQQAAPNLPVIAQRAPAVTPAPADADAGDSRPDQSCQANQIFITITVQQPESPSNGQVSHVTAAQGPGNGSQPMYTIYRPPPAYVPGSTVMNGPQGGQDAGAGRVPCLVPQGMPQQANQVVPAQAQGTVQQQHPVHTLPPNVQLHDTGSPDQTRMVVNGQQVRVHHLPPPGNTAGQTQVPPRYGR